MNSMAEILILLAPIGLLIGTGVVFVRCGWFPAAGLPVMHRFVMRACIPVLIFAAVISGDGLADFAWPHALLYTAASFAAVAVLWLLLRYGLRQPLPRAIILSLGAGSSNTLFLGYPIAATVIPDRAAAVLGWVILAEALFLIPIITALALLADRRAPGIRARDFVLPLLQSPVTIGLIAGLGLLASGASLPGPVADLVGAIARAAPFLALFLIGGTLTQVRNPRAGPSVIALTLAKLCLHPILVFAAFGIVFGWHSQAQLDATLFAAIPIFLSHAIFCARHGVEDVTSSSIVLSTVIGAVTVTILLGWLA